MPHVVFIVNAGLRIGGGHLARCSTLANALVVHGWTVTILVPHGYEAVQLVPLEKGVNIVPVDEAKHLTPGVPLGVNGYLPDLVVVDHYGLNFEYEAHIGNAGVCCMVIDDLANRPHSADILLDQTLNRKAHHYAGLVEDKAILLLGTKYALIRPEFAAARGAALDWRHSENKRTPRIFLGIGAADPDNYIGSILKHLSNRFPAVEINAVVGQKQKQSDPLPLTGTSNNISVFINPKLADMISLMHADLAIGAGGGSVWERCTLGLPGVLLVLAKNQRTNADALMAAGAVRVVSVHEEGWLNQLVSVVSELLEDDHSLLQMSEAASAVCDGLGLQRVVGALEKILR